jgi:hypothetical protein
VPGRYVPPDERDVYLLESDACDIVLTLGLLKATPWWHITTRGGLKLRLRALHERLGEYLVRTGYARRIPSRNDPLDDAI